MGKLRWYEYLLIGYLFISALWFFGAPAYFQFKHDNPRIFSSR